VTPESPVLREATLAAGAAAVLAALLVYLGPPGADLAEHAYQRTLFLNDGFALWNNFWYAGRYSFVTYSVLYYPLAALLGIRLLAVATISAAALAFAVIVSRQWGPTARWSSRTFAVIWCGVVFSAAFPFALGAALALLTIWAAQARRWWRFALLAALTLAASPLAFLLLALLLAGIGLWRWNERASLVAPALTIAAFGAVEVVLWRAFPGSGRYPFSWQELLAAITFCVLGIWMAWDVERTGPLRSMFVVYLVACLAAFAIPSAVGENVARLRYAAIPLAVLTLSLRRWRPLPVTLAVLGLAVSWNISPVLADYLHGRSDPASTRTYWAPAIRYLRGHLTPSYRVEIVDTTGHWGVAYLAEEHIPLARGGYRQNDFPQNQVLYNDLGATAYRAWLRRLGVRYVVLTSAPVDYSARGEAALLRSRRSGLVPVFRTPRLRIFELPDARSILSAGHVLAVTATRMVLELPRPGSYRLAVRYSPYWQADGACLSDRRDGMTTVTASRAGRLELRFHVSAGRALATAVAGQQSRVCDNS
jgi:MFS family permease